MSEEIPAYITFFLICILDIYSVLFTGAIRNKHPDPLRTDLKMQDDY